MDFSPQQVPQPSRSSESRLCQVVPRRVSSKIRKYREAPFRPALRALFPPTPVSYCALSPLTTGELTRPTRLLLLRVIARRLRHTDHSQSLVLQDDRAGLQVPARHPGPCRRGEFLLEGAEEGAFVRARDPGDGHPERLAGDPGHLLHRSRPLNPHHSAAQVRGFAPGGLGQVWGVFPLGDWGRGPAGSCGRRAEAAGVYQAAYRGLLSSGSSQASWCGSPWC